MTTIYQRIQLTPKTWIYTSLEKWQRPQKVASFAFDTETLVMFDGEVIAQDDLFEKTRLLKETEKRERLTTKVWAWQAYDDKNGFFMTNDFDTFLEYCCYAQFNFGWCYNAVFDFAQIDYKILAEGKGKWKPHERAKNGKGYDRGQPWTFSSLHSATGARYCYKLWVPHKNDASHVRTHAVEFRDFAKLIQGGLGKCLADMDVRDNDGNPVRKLTMDYQGVDPDNLTDEEIAYCENDVKGLFFAVKQLDLLIGTRTDNDSAIYGKRTNVMTAGGLAKRELLRFLYPQEKTYEERLKKFQRVHPIEEAQDAYYRANHLYRGGITIVNERYKEVPLKRDLYRYDVNSEYPYVMSEIRDLIGRPIKMPFEKFVKMTPEELEDYEVVYMLRSVYGNLKAGMLPVWFDPFKKAYVDEIDETGLHLIYKREYDELTEWYDLEADFGDFVLLFERGERAYRPFVEHYYELKDEAKKTGNNTLKAFAKLMLNSSYGKLSERSEREETHYELNPETGAIHNVRDGVRISFGGHMNVAIGSLITACARVYILSKIREICPCPSIDFVYMDTDSIHTFKPYPNADAFALGGLKLEAVVKHSKYIAPKTYYDLEEDDLKVDPKTGAFKGLELHAKGLNINSIQERLKKRKNPTVEDLNDLYRKGQAFVTLQSINVKGGKALIPKVKFIARIVSSRNVRINTALGILAEA